MTLTYNLGQVTIRNANNDALNLYFDHHGQVSKMVNPLGNATHFTHDSTFNLVGITNALGATARYTYNNAGAVTSATDFLGNTTNAAYAGPYNRLSQLTDANGNVTQYSYNAAGNLTGTTYANGTTESLTRDLLGNALSFVNAAGEPIQYAYNAGGQITSATFPGGSSFTYAYDSHGHLTTATDSTGATTFTYAPTTGYLTGVANPNGTSLTFSYDSAGRRTSMVDQGGFTVNYVYDALGRLGGLKDTANNPIVSYTYDAAGRLNQKANGNGTYTTYQYDAAGKVLHLINYAPGGAVNSRFDDAYNALGLKMSEATLDGAWAYTYDANGQLVHAVFASNNPASIPNQDLAYNYDAIGNRTSTIINGVATVYVANNMNQYSAVGGAAQSHDLKGNLLSDGFNTFTYNVLNRLVTATDMNGTTIYAHNALGQCISKHFDGQTINQQVDPAGLGNIVAEYDGNNNLVARYAHGLGLACQSRNGASHYYDFDPLGNTAGMSDNAGAYSNRYSYAPFGDILAFSASVPNVFQYGGQWGVTQKGNGLYGMRAREYQSGIGRFATRDPLGLYGGAINYYSYVGNTPTSFIDPMGLEEYTVDEITGTIHGAYKVHKWVNDATDENTGTEAFGRAFKEEVSGEGELADCFAVGSEFCDAEAAKSTAAKRKTAKGGMEFIDDLSKLWDYTSTSGIKSLRIFYDLLRMSDVKPFPIDGGQSSSSSSSKVVNSVDPNALYGPTGYGASNFVSLFANTFAYRITYENDAAATAPAQSVTITDNLDSNLDWSTFQLTGIGFGDNNITIPAGSQHYQTTLTMTYNGQTFNVEIEAGLVGDTGQVYAIFQSLDPNTGLPPSSVLTGFLPPEDGTGRGEGYLSFTVSPNATVPTGTIIPNVALITFDAGQSIATNQVSETNPGLGTDPNKEARVTIDANVPTAQVTSFGGYAPATFIVSWSGSGGPGGSGIASYTVYASSDGGATYSPWLIDTPLTSATYTGVVGVTYSFYVVAKSNVGTVQTANTQTAAVSALALTNTNYWRWQNFGIPSNTGIAADNADPDGDGILNIMEFATNTNPTVPNAMPGEVLLDGSDVEFTYTRTKAAIDEGIATGVEWSDSLALPMWNLIDVTETILSDDGKLQQVRATLPAGSEGRRFVRLRVTRP